MEIDPGMQAAIDEMKKGLSEGGIPIGSSLVIDGKIVAAGHNKRVQDGDPITHAEIDCLRNAGRVGASGLHRATLILDADALLSVQRRGGAVRHQESRGRREPKFPRAAPEFMRSHGIEVIDLDLPECVGIMAKFVVDQPSLWNEDIGV